MIRRDWSAAEAKRGPCRNCGSHFRVELAHVVGREHDRMPPVARVTYDWSVSKVLVHPDRVIPLCGPATSTNTCHGMQHNNRLNVLRLLTLTEQIQAVADAGGIYAALQRLDPDHNPRLVRHGG